MSVMHLMRAAHVVRKEIFDSSFSFEESFRANCQQDAVPPSPWVLIFDMILDGANITHQTQLVNKTTTKPALAIFRYFNSVKQARNADSSNLERHSRSQETHYHSSCHSIIMQSREEKVCMVDTLFNMRLCVSYDKLLRMTSYIDKGVCQRFRVEDVVCPRKLRHGLFTTGAVDNIDHILSSATAKHSFHRTGILLIQHPSSHMAELILEYHYLERMALPPSL